MHRSLYRNVRDYDGSVRVLHHRTNGIRSGGHHRMRRNCREHQVLRRTALIHLGSRLQYQQHILQQRQAIQLLLHRF